MTKKEAIPIISKCTASIGDYIGIHLELYTEKVTGATTACLGLILHGNEYKPSTILKEDMRNITLPKPPGKIFVIFRKPIRQDIYTELTFAPTCLLL